MLKNMICISCPLGCHIDVEHEDGKVSSVSGNKCKRGLDYATAEISHPMRSLTTTLKVSGGKSPLVPVKTALPVPKSKIFECMKLINTITLKAPIKMGDVLIKDILGTGVDIVATNNA